MVNVKCTIINRNLYWMVHSIVLKFEKIWLSGTLIIIRKPKVWWTDRHGDPYIHPLLFMRGGVCLLSVIWFQDGGRRSAVVSAEAQKSSTTPKCIDKLSKNWLDWKVVSGHKYLSPSILRYIFHIKPHFSNLT